ncbi:MAG: hypothetical protein ACYCZX_17190 [Rhodospirillaceae bacterium]
MTRKQRIARAARWACDGVAVILGVAAFVDLVGGEGAQGWLFVAFSAVWPAAGFKDTELGVNMEPEVDHGKTEVYAGVQA